MSATGPILVTGPDRSGTTLLYALLASHPDVSMVRRTNMWRWFDQRYGDLTARENLDRCLETMVRYRRLRVLEPDVERIRADFLGGEPTYGRLFSLFHQHHAVRRGKGRWGDKSLHTEYYADRIFSELPEATMVQLVRDPRDRYASIIRRYEGRRKGIGAATGRWISSTRQGRRNVDRYPDRYTLVCYETLASEPERTVQSLCAFLGLDYTPAMLTMRGAHDRDRDEWEGNSSFGDIEPGVISTRSIGRYASVLSPREIAFIQTFGGRLMTAHGYAAARTPLVARDRMAFYGLDLPVKGSRLAGWLSMQMVSKEREGVPTNHLSATPA